MITIQNTINAPIETVWNCWTMPEHITKWNYASEDWHTPYAENNLQIGGKFKCTMASKDGTMGFDFEGEYTDIEKYSLIKYTIPDGRKVEITFEEVENGVKIIENFEAETENPEELQKQGWQSILDNFKKYAENL